MCLFLLRELVEKLPGPHTYLLLGDAYMNIQEVSGNAVILRRYLFLLLVTEHLSLKMES